jgi:hypothetical protein
MMVQMAVICSLWPVMDRSLLRGRDEQDESGFRRGVLDDGGSVMAAIREQCCGLVDTDRRRRLPTIP